MRTLLILTTTLLLTSPAFAESTQPAESTQRAETTQPREASTPAPAPAGGAGVGKKAPALTLTGDGGASTSLTDHAGKVVVVAFWAPWDNTSRRLLATLQELQDAHGDDLVVLAASVDDVRARHKSPLYLDGKGYTVGRWYDSNQSQVKAWSGTNRPAYNAVVGKDGNVTFVSGSFEDEAALTNAVKRAL